MQPWHLKVAKAHLQFNKLSRFLSTIKYGNNGILIHIIFSFHANSKDLPLLELKPQSVLQTMPNQISVSKNVYKCVTKSKVNKQKKLSITFN